MAEQPVDRDIYGVLVGWSHSQFNGKVDLRLQTVQNSHALQQDEVDSHHIVMTREQATLLANYLYTAVGQTPPKAPARGRLGRWFGS